MRGGARVLPGVRCFRGAAAVLGVRGAAVLGGAAAVFGVRGAAAVCATFRRRSRSARFAAVFCAGLCTVFCGSHSACRTLRRTFMPGARPNY